MNNPIVQFIAAFFLCCGLFLAMDAAVMNMQGLSLVFHQ